MPTMTSPATLIDRAALLEALTAVSAAIPNRSPKPVLVNVLLRLSPDGSEVIATDLEIGVRHRLIGAQVDAPVRLLLPPGRLRSILATSDDDEIGFAVGEDRVTIRTRRAEFNLPLEDVSLFPDVPAFEAVALHSVAAGDLRKMIRRTIFAVDMEAVRYALSGCLLECDPGTMTMVGTDGRRLARQVVDASVEGEPAAPTGTVIPARALKLIDRLLDEDEASVHVAVSDKAVLVRTESATIYARLVEGRFPRYQDVLELSEPAAKIHFAEIGDLRMAVEQASIVTSEASRGVDFRFADGVLKLSSQAADVGSSQVEVVTCYEGPAIETSFDPQYLTPALKALGDEAAITLELIDAKSPAVFKSDDNYTYVVMPLTRDR